MTATHEITLIAEKPGICIMLPALSIQEARHQSAALIQAGYQTYWYDTGHIEGHDYDIAAHFGPTGWKPTAHAV